MCPGSLSDESMGLGLFTVHRKEETEGPRGSAAPRSRVPICSGAELGSDAWFPARPHKTEFFKTSGEEAGERGREGLTLCAQPKKELGRKTRPGRREGEETH